MERFLHYMRYIRIFLIVFMAVFIIYGRSFVRRSIYAALFKPSLSGWWTLVLIAYVIFLCYKTIIRLKKKFEPEVQSDEDEENGLAIKEFDRQLIKIFIYFLPCLGIVIVSAPLLSLLSFNLSGIYTRLASDRYESTVVNVDTHTFNDTSGNEYSNPVYSAIVKFQTKDGETLTREISDVSLSKPHLNETITIYYSRADDRIFIHSEGYYIVLAVLFFFNSILLAVVIGIYKYATYGKIRRGPIVFCKMMVKLFVGTPLFIGCSAGLWCIVVSHCLFNDFPHFGTDIIIIIGLVAFLISFATLGYFVYLWECVRDIYVQFKRPPKDRYNRSER